MRAIERRSYLRINDLASVSHQVVSDEQAKKFTAQSLLGLDANFGLRRQLYKLELEARELQREISEKDRKLGSYFHNLNQRLEILTQAVPGVGSSATDDTPTNVLDLSPAGLSYLTKEVFPANDLLALKLSFKHASLGLACYGRICYNQLAEDDFYRIGVQFISLDPTEEALLARHISALQAEERRKRLHQY
jgi:hypothetical protein